MKYITKKTSETGKELQIVLDKIQRARQERNDFADKYCFTHYRMNSVHDIVGTICSCSGFEKEPDTKDWKNSGFEEKEYFPNLRSKIGKKIFNEIYEMTIITKKELNECVNYFGRTSHIGYNTDNDEYFGFVVLEEWKVNVPEDCQEVLTSEYNKMFKLN